MFDEGIIKKIYNSICDQRSRRVFSSRLIYSLTDGNINSLTEIIEESRQIIRSDIRLKKFSEDMKSHEHSLVLFGKGRYAGFFFDYLPSVKWEAIIDINCPMGGGEYRNTPLINYDVFIREYNGQKIVVSSKPYYHDMLEQLERDGVPEENIVDGSFLWDVIEGRQYFDLEYLPHVDKEGFVDVGSLDGLSTVAFREWSKGDSDRCYCFEPDKKNAEKTARNLDKFGVVRYQVFEKGLWDETTDLVFESLGTGLSRFSEEDSGATAIRIPVVRLDDEIGDERITFIKMDIEGAELRALHGAERIIKEQKPKLATCVYHNKEDIWEIPEYVLNLRNDYKLYFRHYVDGVGETVMYAI